MFPALFFLLLWQSPPASQAGHVCGDRDAQTEPLRTIGGSTAFLSMHSEDDHGRNSHECQADYSLHIIHPDGTRTDGPPAFGSSGFFSSIAAWSRPLIFRIDGFSPDGKRVFVFIAEGGQEAFIRAQEFDMVTGFNLRDETADRYFLDKFGHECAATLHVAGTAANGHIVLKTTTSGGCPRTESWQLNADRKTKGGLGSKPGIPIPIADSAKVTALAPGEPRQKPTN